MIEVRGFMFWSSGILTGSQTFETAIPDRYRFWSSGILTGSQTSVKEIGKNMEFWSSGILTGSQTECFWLRVEIFDWKAFMMEELTVLPDDAYFDKEGMLRDKDGNFLPDDCYKTPDGILMYEGNSMRLLKEWLFVNAVSEYVF